MSNLDNLVNTYEGRPGLSELEVELLWEYAKTAALIKDITTATRALVQHSQQSISSDERRAIDDKIALVFTLLKASVWDFMQANQENDNSLDI